MMLGLLIHFSRDHNILRKVRVQNRITLSCVPTSAESSQDPSHRDAHVKDKDTERQLHGGAEKPCRSED